MENINLEADNNGSFINITFDDDVSPSQYSLPRLVITALFVAILILLIVVSNMLVIIAIVTDNKLKQLQNVLIANLAVSDMLLGVVVMPFSLANELMGYWAFGDCWCDIYLATDVLLCTASIMNICLVSLDRYWSITQAVSYSNKRTSLRMGMMIASVWMLSALISLPPLLGWKGTPQTNLEYPQCLVSAVPLRKFRIEMAKPATTSVGVVNTFQVGSFKTTTSVQS